MKTTKRSKMLLSSIAMLLVALVALGSASFAWYYNQTTVTANDAKIKAAAASGLEIKHKAGGTWTTGITFDAGAADGYAPASTDFNDASGSLCGATGGQGTSYKVGTLANTLTYVAPGNDMKAAPFYYDDAYVASSGAACNAYTKVEVTGADNTYIIFLVYVDGTLVSKFTTDTASGAPTTATKIKQDTTDTTKAVEDGTVSGLKVAGTADAIATAFTAKTKAAGGTHVEVFGFVDGFNEKCTSEKANLNEVELDLSFKTTAW